MKERTTAPSTTPSFEPRQVDLVDWGDSLAAVRELLAADRDLVAVDDEPADDLAEGERHDGDVVPSEPECRQAYEHAGDRRDHHRDQDHHQEVEVDPRQVRGRLADEQ